MAQDIRKTAAWQRLRARVIREQPWCSYCGSETNLTADHIVPLIEGGAAMDPANITVACAACNGRKGQLEGIRARKGGLRPSKGLSRRPGTLDSSLPAIEKPRNSRVW